ncbi:hypothetical protein HMI56_007148 [Coelomomyces lativittatus]|nr:hypothetical protein HMI56_007148 [Coelomomyces lativittatus]
MIAETPSNPSSSRSHCIFMMTLISHTAQGDTQLRSKLHLVDLAGSERVAKTKLDGHLLKEAKFINLSLHYLEQVILALHEKALGKRQHIPYRNSMMTSILRDSLGGNCQTTMIATIATEQHLLEESISTCRFAQRVALISNRVSINEELDPYVLIARLKKQIAELKTQLAIARGEQEVQEDEEGGTKGNELLAGPLSNDQLLQCRQAVKKFMEGDATSLKLISNVSQLQFCFRVFKEFMLVKPELSSSATSFEKSHPSNDDPDEIKYLKKQLQQRDTEIGVLIPMVNKYKEKLKKFETNTENGLSLSFSSSSPHHADELNKPLSSQQNEKNTLWAFPSSSKNSISPMSPSLETLHSKSFERIGHHEWNQAKKWDDASLGPTPSTSMTTTTMRTTPSKKFPSKSLEKMSSLDPSSSTRQHRPTSSIVSMNSPPPSWSLLEEFKNQYQALPLIEEQKEELKLKYIEAKQLGVEANELRNRISMFF